MLWKTVRCLWTLDKSRVGRANATVPLLESGHPQRMSRDWAHAVGSPSGRKRPCRLTAKLWQTTLANSRGGGGAAPPHHRVAGHRYQKLPARHGARGHSGPRIRAGSSPSADDPEEPMTSRRQSLSIYNTPRGKKTSRRRNYTTHRPISGQRKGRKT